MTSYDEYINDWLEGKSCSQEPACQVDSPNQTEIENPEQVPPLLSFLLTT